MTLRTVATAQTLSMRGRTELAMLDQFLWSIILGRESCAKKWRNIADIGHGIGVRGKGVVGWLSEALPLFVMSQQNIRVVHWETSEILHAKLDLKRCLWRKLSLFPEFSKEYCLFGNDVSNVKNSVPGRQNVVTSRPVIWTQ